MHLLHQNMTSYNPIDFQITVPHYHLSLDLLSPCERSIIHDKDVQCIVVI